MSENNILGVVLAGGKSKRFGEDKSTIKLNDKTLIEHTLDKIKSKLNKIIISYLSQTKFQTLFSTLIYFLYLTHVLL